MFRETLEMVVRKIKRYRSFYEQNETAVRHQLVNPILRSLGWNPENPEEVQPNISTEEGIPDYALIKIILQAVSLMPDDSLRGLAIEEIC